MSEMDLLRVAVAASTVTIALLAVVVRHLTRQNVAWVAFWTDLLAGSAGDTVRFVELRRTFKLYFHSPWRARRGHPRAPEICERHKFNAKALLNEEGEA